MNKLLEYIRTNKSLGRKMLAVLLDPDKCTGALLDRVATQLHGAPPDFIFIGGSSKQCSSDALIRAMEHLPTPKVLFPGDASQFSAGADALLFLSLISGRNPDYLIGQHVTAALSIKASGIEVIPTGYVLINGGTHAAVSRISATLPIAADNTELCLSTAVAGQLLGMQLIYLEAGSGAAKPVAPHLIAATARELTVPLIVGGGIRSIEQLTTAFDAGADLVVVGNAFESDPEKISAFTLHTAAYNGRSAAKR